MRIAFVAWRDLAHPLAGGSEVAIDRLALGLRSRGHEVALLCGGPTAPHPYEAVDLGGTFSQYLRAPLAAHRFRDWDLLVDVQNGVPFWSPLWRRGPSLCLVHHVHTQQWADRFSPPVATLGRYLERRAMPRVYRDQLYVAASESTATGLRGLGVDGANIRVLSWGTDVPLGPRVPRSTEPQFVVLGRLVPHKRVDLILRLWRQVREQTGGRLVVVGDGPERNALLSRADDGVDFVGAVTDPEKWRLLRESWALVHGASHEGWGVVVMEAAAVGTPALGFDVPGIRESIVDGRTGLLASSEAEFVERWCRMATDERLRRRLGEAAERRARGFSWSGTAGQFAEIAEEAIARAAPVQIGREIAS